MTLFHLLVLCDAEMRRLHIHLIRDLLHLTRDSTDLRAVLLHASAVCIEFHWRCLELPASTYTLRGRCRCLLLVIELGTLLCRRRSSWQLTQPELIHVLMVVGILAAVSAAGQIDLPLLALPAVAAGVGVAQLLEDVGAVAITAEAHLGFLHGRTFHAGYKEDATVNERSKHQTDGSK